jgi:porin
MGQNTTNPTSPPSPATTGSNNSPTTPPPSDVTQTTKSAQPTAAETDDPLGPASNPGAVNTIAGTGWLGRTLGIPADTGVRLGGIWLGDSNWVMSGGANPGNVTFNSLFIADVYADLKKAVGLDGASVGAEFLQYNGQPTNAQAGSVQGYNCLVGPPPLNRSQLYQLWWRQEFFDGRLIVRIGKTVPTIDFNNVVRPVPVQNENRAIPSVSGLLYTPLFINPTLIGVSPGYYNSAYGATVTFAPRKDLYASYGAYDGSGAQGVQTGETGPHFNGRYFQIAEAGYAWELGAQRKPGEIAVGGWLQNGQLSLPSGVTQNGAQGVYAFGSQRLWFENPGVDNSGVSGFFQYGINHAHTLPINQYAGAGLTAFGLVPGRTQDSFGAGVAWSQLNHHIFQRSDEWMVQGYYQAHLFGTAYFQPAVTFIPNPGANPNRSAAWTLTLRLLVLF